MTLAQQFPDVSGVVRKKHKKNSSHDATPIFKSRPFKSLEFDQKFYDHEFRIWHYKVIAFIAILLTSMFMLVLNGRNLFNWIMSLNLIQVR
jgi:hypothetical protein